MCSRNPAFCRLNKLARIGAMLRYFYRVWGLGLVGLLDMSASGCRVLLKAL